MSIATSLSSDSCFCPINPSHDASWALPQSNKQILSDHEVLEEVNAWMDSQLPCVAGRREFKRGKYMVRVASRDSVTSIFQEYVQALNSQEAVACLFVFNNSEFAYGKASVFDAFMFLAKQMESLSPVPAKKLARGAALTNSIELECPITGTQTTFDDFECIAFCPQSNDPNDPLYDPLLAMPFPAVNLSSDMYAFSKFVSDEIKKMTGILPYEIRDATVLEPLFHRCIARWQRVAVATIDRYEVLTNTNRCPVHVTSDQTHWIAGHKDPAFAEAIKEVHKHELPILYGARIVESWLDYFRTGKAHEAKGLARDGLPTAM
jgi:hypothetical protein